MWQKLRSWIDSNDKTIRFIAWILVGVWAVLATVAANWPRQTYVVINSVIVPPAETRGVDKRCDKNDFAQTYKVYAVKPTSNSGPVYMTNADELFGDSKVRDGYAVTVMNGGGRQNPRRDDLNIRLEVTCEYHHSEIVRWLLIPWTKLKSLVGT